MNCCSCFVHAGDYAIRIQILIGCRGASEGSALFAPIRLGVRIDSKGFRRDSNNGMPIKKIIGGARRETLDARKLASFLDSVVVRQQGSNPTFVPIRKGQAADSRGFAALSNRGRAD